MSGNGNILLPFIAIFLFLIAIVVAYLFHFVCECLFGV
jgi:hypothetical protein